MYDNDKPIAFGHWMVRDLPHVGKVYCDFIYSWVKDRRPADLLIDKFIEFGKKHRAVIYEGDAINDPVFRAFQKIASRKGYYLTKSNHINFTGRKK